MRVLAHGRALCHRLDHRPPEVLRVRAREADPLDPLDRVARAEELAELGADLRQEIASPRVHVLPEQRDLADTLAGQPRHLGDDLAGPPADLAAADGGNDAVRALRVAAHRDLHPGLEGALAVHRQASGEAAPLEPEGAARDAEAAGADPVAKVRDRARAEGDVDVGVELEQPLPLGLRIAAAHGDHLLRVALLQRLCLRQVGGEALIRLLADRASVEDEHVRLLLCRRLTEPELLEHTLDPLGIVRVHLAAERRDVVALHGAKGSRYLARWPSAWCRCDSAAGWAAGCAPPSAVFRATSTARLSRITVTLIWPGYSSWSSISRAISCESSTAWSSSTSFGLTITRISRPAWSA